MWGPSNAPVCLQTSPYMIRREIYSCGGGGDEKRNKKKHKARDRLEATGLTKMQAR